MGRGSAERHGRCRLADRADPGRTLNGLVAREGAASVLAPVDRCDCGGVEREQSPAGGR
ncbi:hypothetical protein D779_3481 [Imhoffiella purpurea]|uniref:Uncharacterized protein n=1 Tax=Imhoffiella purpurea TaxID=1249627 RepID=W9V9Z1_9GAMM|nr:hypothetical protein D779_3481 [Imhoffiella purpurea]